MSQRENQTLSWQRVAVALGGGLLAFASVAGPIGLVLSHLSGAVVISDVLSDTHAMFWATVFGLPAGLLAMTGLLVLLGRRTRWATIGRYGMAAVLLVFGTLVVWWNLMWEAPLIDLEGSWMWALGVVPLIGGMLALRDARRGRPGGAVGTELVS